MYVFSESTKQDPSYHKARFLCSVDCLICLCVHQKFESFLYIHEMYWDSMSEDVKKDCKMLVELSNELLYYSFTRINMLSIVTFRRYN